MDRYSAVILDSQELFAMGLGGVLARGSGRPRMHCAVDFSAAVTLIAGDPGIRLAIVDLAAPGVAGARSMRELRDRFPHLRVIVSTATPGGEEALECLASGAQGVVCHTQPAREIVAAIRTVLAGGLFIPPAGLAVEPKLAAASEPDNDNREPDLPAPRSAGTEAQLSGRQAAVLRLLRLGLSNKEIARELCLAEGTVKVHLAALYRTLRVHNRTSAVVTAARSMRQEQLGRTGTA